MEGMKIFGDPPPEEKKPEEKPPEGKSGWQLLWEMGQGKGEVPGAPKKEEKKEGVELSGSKVNKFYQGYGK